MPNLSSLTTNFFPTPNEGFTTTTSGSIDSSTDTTIGLNSVSGLTDGAVFTGLIDPGNAKERAFTGVVDTGGSQITGVKFTTGSNATHTAGATIVDYVTGTHIGQISKGIRQEHNQDGTHGNITATSITTSSLTLSGQSNDGWLAPGGTHSVSTGYNAGNRSFTINTSTDLSSIVSNGMRYRVTRGTTPPTQCADLEASSSHYASKSSPSGITLGTTASFEAWVNLESYTANAGIITRYAGGATVGWTFEINSDGTVQVLVGESSNTDDFSTYQSVPLNRWVHLAATVNVSTNSYAIYIDGVSVPISTASTTATGIADSGNLELGARNATTFLDGKLADVRVWSDVRTATEIQDNMYAYPSDTTGLVAHFKLNGDFTDASSNGNDLTAQNSAVATNADNPWNATEYGIITNVTSSTIQVFCPEGYGIPNETLTAPFYSTQSAPYGFPRDKGKWTIQTIVQDTTLQQNSPTTNVWYNISGTSGTSGGVQVTAPVGAWNIGYSVAAASAGSNGNAYTTLTATDTTEDDKNMTMRVYVAGVTLIVGYTARNKYVNLSSATTYYVNVKSDSTVTAIRMYAAQAPSIVYAECAYL